MDPNHRELSKIESYRAAIEDADNQICSYIKNFEAAKERSGHHSYTLRVISSAVPAVLSMKPRKLNMTTVISEAASQNLETAKVAFKDLEAKVEVFMDHLSDQCVVLGTELHEQIDLSVRPSQDLTERDRSATIWSLQMNSTMNCEAVP